MLALASANENGTGGELVVRSVTQSVGLARFVATEDEGFALPGNMAAQHPFVLILVITQLRLAPVEERAVGRLVKDGSVRPRVIRAVHSSFDTIPITLFADDTVFLVMVHCPDGRNCFYTFGIGGRTEPCGTDLKVKPSRELRNLGVAVRGGKDASAYIRFNGRKAGWCRQYGPTNAYHDIAPFKVGTQNRLRIELNTGTAKMKAWINGAGGTEWPFHSAAAAVGRIDLFMSHGNGPEVFALVDDIVVRDDKGNVVLREDFERYYGGESGRNSSSERGTAAPRLPHVRANNSKGVNRNTPKG